MANIAINTYCNLNCPYCYIDQLKSCKVKTMPVEDFTSILTWLAESEEDTIGLTGGEPTLHPNFDEILKETDRYCRKLNATAMLYTNGTNLQDYLPYITDNILIFLHYIPEADQSEIIDLLNELDYFSTGGAMLTCSLHLGEKRYRSFWNIVEKYNLKSVEAQLIMPHGEYSRYQYDKEKYYNLMKPIFLQFCKDAIKYDCVISMGCPEIPMCYFTKEEQEIIDQACDVDTIDHSVCAPAIEILPDWTASLCFVSGDELVDARPFNSFIDLERYLSYKHVLPRIEGNCLGRCTSCPESKLLQCQGGCLCFADI